MHLKLADKKVHVDSDIVSSTQALCSLLPKVYPPQCSKICRLSTVEASIETSVVAIWKGDDELSLFLNNLWYEKVIHH